MHERSTTWSAALVLHRRLWMGIFPATRKQASPVLLNSPCTISHHGSFYLRGRKLMDISLALAFSRATIRWVKSGVSVR